MILGSSSGEKLSRLKKQSSNPPLLTVNYAANSEGHEEVLEHTQGIGVKLVIEVGGTKLYIQLLFTLWFNPFLLLFTHFLSLPSLRYLPSILTNGLNHPRRNERVSASQSQHSHRRNIQLWSKEPIFFGALT